MKESRGEQTDQNTRQLAGFFLPLGNSLYNHLKYLPTGTELLRVSDISSLSQAEGVTKILDRIQSGPSNMNVEMARYLILL